MSRRTLFTLIGIVSVVAAAGWLLRAPSDSFVLLPDKPNRADTVVRAAGETPPHGNAGIYYLDVLIRQATVPEAWLARFEDDADVINRDALIPKGVSQTQQHQADVLQTTDSKVVASVVALRALGKKVEVRGQGVAVEEVLASAPSYRAGLRRGMRIVALDGKAIGSLSALHAALAGRKPGAAITLGVRTPTGDRTIATTLTESRERPGTGAIGIAGGDTIPKVRLPVKIDIRTGALGGPSAGLAFALEIYDSLSKRAFADRGKVAVTGTIDFNGAVGPIGGMRQKAIGARNGGANLLIVPRENYAEAKQTIGGALRIVPVGTFREALAVLHPS